MLEVIEDRAEHQTSSQRNHLNYDHEFSSVLLNGKNKQTTKRACPKLVSKTCVCVHKTKGK